MNDTIELSDGGYIEPPDSDNGTIRRRDVNGNCEEIRYIDDHDWYDWASLFEVNRETFTGENNDIL